MNITTDGKASSAMPIIANDAATSITLTATAATAATAAATTAATTTPATATATATAAASSDEPKWSSAALSTTLTLLSQSFAPEFTHQCVQDESFRGHRPLRTVLADATAQEKKKKTKTKTKASTSTSSKTPTATTATTSAADATTSEVVVPHRRRGLLLPLLPPPPPLLHRSHVAHGTASYELDVQIQLAPSGQTCHVDIRRHPITIIDDSIDDSIGMGIGIELESSSSSSTSLTCPPPSKRRKPDNDLKASATVAPLATASPASPALPSSPSPSPPPLSEEEIQQSIAKALPAIVSKDVELEYLEAPLGTVLSEYSITPRWQQWRQKKDRDDDDDMEDHAPLPQAQAQPQTFVLSVADGASVGAYHSQVQRLALWFIETADEVDVANDTGDRNQSGFWKVLYLFQRHHHDHHHGPNSSSTSTSTSSSITTTTTKNKTRYSLVGYVTLFHFHAPFHKPTPGMVVRICQALILPPYQGQGHGKQLLQAVYDLVHHHDHGDDDGDGDDGDGDGNGGDGGDIQKKKKKQQQQPQHPPPPPISIPIVQVNVEDPAPGFVALRNKVDWELLTSHPEWWCEEDGTTSTTTMTSTSTSTTATTTAAAAADRRTLPFQSDPAHLSARSKLTLRQVQIVQELVQLQTLLLEQKKEQRTNSTANANANVNVNVNVNDNDNDNDIDKDVVEEEEEERRREQDETRFRLRVKKRLHREHREELSACATKDEQKAFLATRYDEEHQQYLRILQSRHSLE